MAVGQKVNVKVENLEERGHVPMYTQAVAEEHANAVVTLISESMHEGEHVRITIEPVLPARVLAFFAALFIFAVAVVWLRFRV
jgi:hypothetical protein